VIGQEFYKIENEFYKISSYSTKLGMNSTKVGNLIPIVIDFDQDKG
jgi:hypothetical protein